MRNLSLLYSTIVHEYVHVLDLRQGKDKPDDELRAYMAEALALEKTGGWRDPKLLRELWMSLNREWNALGSPANLRHAKAYEAAVEALLRGKKRLRRLKRKSG
jgi:hypothetical protein